MNNLRIELWRRLPDDRKLQLRKLFGVSSSGSKQVVDNRVVDDGVLEKDLVCINEDSLRAQVGEVGSVDELWVKLQEKLWGNAVLPAEVPVEAPKEVAVEPEPKVEKVSPKRGRPKKLGGKIGGGRAVKNPESKKRK